MPDINENIKDAVPLGKLALLPLASCAEMGKEIDEYLVDWRKDRHLKYDDSPFYAEYSKDSFIINALTPRFGTGEAKGLILDTVRGKDLYILVDVCNYSLTYTVCGHPNHMSPDDHFADLKRIIAAVEGQARRVNVIMPFLYESRQHRRTGRESLDCAIALHELVNMGVTNIITFDAHDTRVQNSIPLGGFQSISPIYQFIKALLINCPEIKLDPKQLMVISPDEGSMSRAIFMASNLGINMGAFYKRRDYSTVVNGRNPIIAHEFLGGCLKDKDVIVIDDMISSGDSMLEVAELLKERGARNIYICCTFGLFTNGLEKFDEAYENGYFTKILTTNLIYQTQELLSRSYYVSVDMSKFIALIIDTLNHDASISSLLDPSDRIRKVVDKFNNGEKIPF